MPVPFQTSGPSVSTGRQKYRRKRDPRSTPARPSQEDRARYTKTLNSPRKPIMAPAQRGQHNAASSNPLLSERAQARPRSLSQSSSQAAQRHPSLLPAMAMLRCELLSSAIVVGTNVGVSAFFALEIPGLPAPTMRQAAAHAMSTGDCGDVRARRETLRDYPSALLVAPTPATACSANQLDTAAAPISVRQYATPLKLVGGAAAPLTGDRNLRMVGSFLAVALNCTNWLMSGAVSGLALRRSISRRIHSQRR